MIEPTRTPSKRWYVIEVCGGRRKVNMAMSFIGAEGDRAGQIWDVFAPVQRRIELKQFAFLSTAELCYAPYIFASWPQDAPWAGLLTDEAVDAGITGILRDERGIPRPMPHVAFLRMQAFAGRDPQMVTRDVRQLLPGQAVWVYLTPGHAQQAVFLGYGKGGRAVVTVWIFGRESDVPVPIDAVEAMPVEIGKSVKRAEHGDHPLRPFK